MKDIYNNILVPFDFGERSMAALEESYNLAKITGLEITIYHVIRDNKRIFSAFGGERSKTMKRDYESQIRNQMQEVAAEASRKSGVKVNAVIAHGKAHDKILKGAHLLGSKFIVQGINGENTDSKDNSIGTNALRVIKNAECPVITVKNKQSYKGCRSILLPLDLTQETKQKVTQAIEMAKICGSTIKIVSVYWSASRPDILNKLQLQMNQVKAFIKKSNIKCTGEIIEKSGSSKILAPIALEYAKTHEDIDMVMIMTQHESGLFDLFLGSSAQYFISNSDVPVMTIIPKVLGFSSMLS